jgi:hypothetical protein
MKICSLCALNVHVHVAIICYQTAFLFAIYLVGVNLCLIFNETLSKR